MANPLLTGVSGLASHQKMLEVIGNNLANLNSTAYKQQRVLFSDLLYSTLSSASSGTDGVLGGINPSQVGSGSQVAAVDSNFQQGNLQPTGQPLDFAIDGDGFFVVSAGQAPRYTRAGAFRVDADGVLVDPSTGFRVQRFGDVGEPNGVDPGFQVPGDNGIHVPFGVSIPGRTTAEVNISGNLSSDALIPTAGELASNAGWTVGGVPATATTLLNDLDSSDVDYVAGDSVLITGTHVDGSPVNASLAVSATSTLGDLQAALAAAYPDATVTLGTDGKFNLVSNTTGESFMSLQLRDATTNTGGVQYDQHPTVVIQEGHDGTTVLGGFEVYDIRGKSHTVRAVMQKQTDGSWNLTASIDTDEGTLTDSTISNIRFNDDGSFLQAGGAGLADTNLIFNFAGVATAQSVRLRFGSANSFDGLTQLASSSSIAAQQDGFGAGTLVDIQVNADGLIKGTATNGRSIDLAQLAIASFRNPSGLTRVGSNYFDSSLASGDVQMGTALSGDRGRIRANHLELSNVDIAQEFTQLIIAQRGFSANARTITVTDQVLQELTQLIR
jgi:flagellar hook protein FlgE